MGKYANTSKVEVDRTKAEIEKVVRKYGASQFLIAIDDERGQAIVQFKAKDRIIKFRLNLPVITDKEFTHIGRQKRSEQSAYNAWKQATRSCWRALLLCIKAKLEAVESGICTFEDEFMAHIVLPDGKTVQEWLNPQIALAYEKGDMPTSLLALPNPNSK